MKSTPRVRLHGTQNLNVKDVSISLRSEKGAVDAPGKKALARKKRALQKLLREQWSAALAAYAKENQQKSNDPKWLSGLLSHVESLVKKTWREEPPLSFSNPQSNITPPAPTDRESSSVPAVSCESHRHVIAQVQEMPSDEIQEKRATPPSRALDLKDIAFDSQGRVSPTDAVRLRNYFPEVVLYAPQIPPNTGTVARLCGALSSRLHLVEPLGFDVSEKAVRRAGLDYWSEVEVTVHGSLQHVLQARPYGRVLLIETGSGTSPAHFEYQPGDLLFFGSETKGLPSSFLEEITALGKEKQSSYFGRVHWLTVPMFSPKVRSINLANTVSMVLYSAVENLKKKLDEPFPQDWTSPGMKSEDA
jgi:tRNA (cytidine/uridine-2'-O-)-methyltransferase